jgi:hypothetical protein
MNDLLFYALLIALIYYFFFYLPQQKKLSNSTQPSPIFNTKETQTEPFPKNIPNSEEIKELKKDIAQKEQTITGLNNSYEKLEQKKAQQITELQTQIRELVKRPLKPTNSKNIQTDSEENLTEVIDTLIKNIQELNNSL